jgi:hypothetical protein
MTYLNARPAPSRAPGCAGKLLILALLGAVAFIAVGGAKLIPAAAVDVSVTPTSSTPTIRPVSPELDNLAITQAALDIEGTELAYHGTALANEAVAAQVTQQAAIFGTQLARDAIHAAMTETTEAQQANRAAAWAQETDTILQSNAQLKAQIARTAEAWQSTAAVATQAAIVDEWAIAQNKRATAERLAGVETILWRIIIPLAVAVCICLIAGGFTTMLTRRYGVAREVEPEEYDPPVIQPVKVEIKSNGGKTMQFTELPGTSSQLRQFVAGVLNGTPTTEAAWCGANNPFSIADFRALRYALIQNDMARWVNDDAHEQGWQMTEKGMQVMESIALEFTALSPAPEFYVN